MNFIFDGFMSRCELNEHMTIIRSKQVPFLIYLLYSRMKELFSLLFSMPFLLNEGGQRHQTISATAVSSGHTMPEIFHTWYNKPLKENGIQ